MDPNELHRVALRMLADYDAHQPNEVFAERGSDWLALDDAYAIQSAVADLRQARGEQCIGFKIGCTSPVIQQQLGIREPIYGRLFDTGCFGSGTRLSHANYANLAVEGELAIRLAKDLSDSSFASEESWDVIDSIFPVIELHNYALRSPRPCCQELIASNGMHAGFIAAQSAHGGPVARVQHLTMLLNDRIVAESAEPWTMRGPIASLLWLVARLGERGLHLSRGQVILTGSSMPLYLVSPGSRVVVEAQPAGRCFVDVDL